MEISESIVYQGAEARLYLSDFLGKPCIIKERFTKQYRHPELDWELTRERIKSEVRSLVRSRIAGVHTPTVYFIDLPNNKIYMEYLENSPTVKSFIEDFKNEENKMAALGEAIGQSIGRLHMNNIVHGDLTSSNLLIKSTDPLTISVIDFGLSYIESSAEDKGVDLYVLERALVSTHSNAVFLFDKILHAYRKSNKDAKDVLAKFEDVRLRGRKRLMIG